MVTSTDHSTAIQKQCNKSNSLNDQNYYPTNPELLSMELCDLSHLLMKTKRGNLECLLREALAQLNLMYYKEPRQTALDESLGDISRNLKKLTSQKPIDKTTEVLPEIKSSLASIPKEICGLKGINDGVADIVTKSFLPINSSIKSIEMGLQRTPKLEIRQTDKDVQQPFARTAENTAQQRRRANPCALRIRGIEENTGSADEQMRHDKAEIDKIFSFLGVACKFMVMREEPTEDKELSSLLLD